MTQTENELRILQVLERDPETTQASVAAQVGVAIGTVNATLRRLIRDGCVEATKMERRRLRYVVTPEGLALKARMASQYLEESLLAYRDLRQKAAEAVADVRAAGYRTVAVSDYGDSADILRLTCLELGVTVADGLGAGTPAVRPAGLGYTIEWPQAGER
jgi:DNA-binding MarR family transcriptional regulator